MNAPTLRLSRKAALVLLELNRGNTLISVVDTMGRRYCRWKNFRGKARAGKPGVLTFRSFRKKGLIEQADEGKGEWQIAPDGTEAALSIDLDDPYYRKRRKARATAGDVLKALETYYRELDFVVVPEVSLGYRRERAADALVLGHGNETAIAIEIKVTRRDFRQELGDEGKRQMALDLSSQFFFAAPRGVIDLDELPPECGLFELGIDGKISPTVPAPHRRPGMPDWRLVGAVARALKR